ncbi:hypothetical protein BC938DRAFT_480286 [Jimgerdemannia flammicorona]|uniref:Uncharacterized protein n=1 Tax=Jimgerdemannia flammicorona TaxID=994334 RepID=A0A433QIU6_9FUNG|nr:hypothetical protein BC938DRAFT_480286 [Jimgerdemannia flammicorona]
MVLTQFPHIHYRSTNAAYLEQSSLVAWPRTFPAGLRSSAPSTSTSRRMSIGKRVVGIFASPPPPPPNTHTLQTPMSRSAHLTIGKGVRIKDVIFLDNSAKRTYAPFSFLVIFSIPRLILLPKRTAPAWCSTGTPGVRIEGNPMFGHQSTIARNGIKSQSWVRVFILGGKEITVKRKHTSVTVLCCRTRTSRPRLRTRSSCEGVDACVRG